MDVRQLGRTGIKATVLSYGCGAVGGLMTKGAPADQERAVQRALDMGITYFDTAAQYGMGTSETNLGRILAKLRPKITVATKVRLQEAEYANARRVRGEIPTIAPVRLDDAARPRDPAWMRDIHFDDVFRHIISGLSRP